MIKKQKQTPSIFRRFTCLLWKLVSKSVLDVGKNKNFVKKALGKIEVVTIGLEDHDELNWTTNYPH